MIHAAREAFACHGFHATGMAQIAQNSGVLVGQIYRDFANKEAIVAAIVERGLDDFLSDKELCAAADTGDLAGVRDWIARFVACEEIENAQLMAEIFAEAARNPRIAAIVRHMDDRIADALGRVLRLLVPDAPDDRIAHLAEMILTAANGVFQRRLIDPAQPGCEAVTMLMRAIDGAIGELASETQSQA